MCVSVDLFLTRINTCRVSSLKAIGSRPRKVRSLVDEAVCSMFIFPAISVNVSPSEIIFGRVSKPIVGIFSVSGNSERRSLADKQITDNLFKVNELRNSYYILFLFES